MSALNESEDQEYDFVKTFIAPAHNTAASKRPLKSPHRKLYLTLHKHFRNTDMAGKKPHVAKLAKYLSASLRQLSKPKSSKGHPYISVMHKKAFSYLKKELSQSELDKIRHDASVKAWKTRKQHGESMSALKEAKAFFQESEDDHLTQSQLDKIRHEAAIKAWKTRRLHGFQFTMKDHDSDKIRSLIKANAPHAKISVKGKVTGPSPSHTYKVDFGDKGISHDTAKMIHKAAFNSHLRGHAGKRVIFSKVVHSDDREHGAGEKKTSHYYAPSIPIHDEHGVMDPRYRASMDREIYRQMVKHSHPHGTGGVGQED